MNKIKLMFSRCLSHVGNKDADYTTDFYQNGKRWSCTSVACCETSITHSSMLLRLGPFPSRVNGNAHLWAIRYLIELAKVKRKGHAVYTNRRQVVQRWPAVPTAANNTERTASVKLASSITMIALFPLSSSNVLPCLAFTLFRTSCPTWTQLFWLRV